MIENFTAAVKQSGKYFSLSMQINLKIMVFSNLERFLFDSSDRGLGGNLYLTNNNILFFFLKIYVYY